MSNEFPNNPPESRKSAEKIAVPTEAEVTQLIESAAGMQECVRLRSAEDEEGLYLLEFSSFDSDGDPMVYRYQRAGTFPEGSSTETVIDAVFYIGEDPVGGDCVAKCVDGVWKKL